MGEILQFKADPEFLRASAKAAFEEQDFMTAIPLYNKAIELAPENTDFRIELAICYLAMGATDEARALSEEMLAADRDVQPAVFMTYAHCLIAEGELHAAFDMLKRFKDEEVRNMVPDDDDETFDVEMLPDIGLADDSDEVSDLLREVVETGDLQGALELLESMDKQADNYPEALKAVAVIYIGQGKKRKARPYLDKVLLLRPDDVFALTALATVDTDAARRDGYIERLIDIPPDGYAELARMCSAARAVGVTPRSLELIDKLYKIFPFNKAVLESVVKLYADSGQCDRARETALKAKRLFPRDCVFAELNRQVGELQGAGELTLEDGLGEEENERRIEALETWLEHKSSVNAVVRGLKENAKMDEYVRWLFQTDLYSVQVNVGCFLAQSVKWQPFVRAQLLKDIPDALKYEYIKSLLFYAQDKRYRLISGGTYYEYEPRAPIDACDAFVDAYYTAYAGFSVSQDDFELKLERMYRSLVFAFGGVTVEGKDDPTCIAAALVHAARCRKPSLSKRDISELFGVSVADIDAYTKTYFTTRKGGRKNAGL